MLHNSKNLWVIVQRGRPLDLEHTFKTFNKDKSALTQSELLFEIYSDFDLAVSYVENLKIQSIDMKSEEQLPPTAILEIIPLSVFLSKMMEDEYNLGNQDGRSDGYDSGYEAGRSDGYDRGYDVARKNCSDEQEPL